MINKLFNTDWLNNNIPDKSINLIIADPPYFEVKGEFDFIWKSFGDYLQDVEKWAVECKRVLADNGSLLWWGHAKKIAYSQIIFDKYFKLENNLVWEKTDCQTRKGYDSYNSFPPVTEHCLFYGNRYLFSDIIQEHMKIKNIKESDFRKLRPSKNGNSTGWCSNIILGKNQPTIEDWKLIDSLLCTQIEYFDLKRYYENIYKLTDVIKNAQEVNITGNYDHETIKPLTLTKKLIQTTTRKGDTVLIPFGGSGTEVEACIGTDRKYICYEIDEKHYKTIQSREKKSLLQGDLFLSQEIQKHVYTDSLLFV